MTRSVRIKKGLDIPLEGMASGKPVRHDADVVGIVPDDFRYEGWKVRVKAGDTVKKGSVLLSDKVAGKVCLVSPVSGVVAEVKRGERRRIEYVSVRSDGRGESDSGLAEACAGASVGRDALVSLLCRYGLWAMISQRPFDIVPDPEVVPRDIFVMSFDSAPLAGNLIGADLAPYLESGLEALCRLTAGKVYLGVRPDSGITSEAAEVVEISGPHPAGNAGVLIAAVKPVNKGETVWTLDALTAARIGKLISRHSLDMTAVVAVTGPEVKHPGYVETTIGAALGGLLAGNIMNPSADRVISGNVLTGSREDADSGFLRRPYRQITVIPEGDKADEFMGWASMSPKKYSVKRSFPAFLRGLGKPFPFDARIKGGERAMILSGEYDKVFPFDIYPEYLIKAILANDIDRMEQLGIYEVAPEDFALPEFVDTSKLELQKIVRDGLDRLRSEL